MSIWQKAKQQYHARPSASFFAGCLIGGLVFVCIYGIRVLDVTNDAWLLDSSQCEKLWDLTQHYLGWVYYRKSPWHFPFGLLDDLYLDSVSILYTDSIPLFAMFFKLLSPILPETFQYFGIFGLLCYVLMGGFGVLLMRRMTPHVLPQWIGGAFFVLSPCLLKRTFYHTALSAHFLILAAFCLWAYREEILAKPPSMPKKDAPGIAPAKAITAMRGRLFPRLRHTLSWCAICAASFLTNPYLTPMVFGVLACSLLHEWLLKHDFWDWHPWLKLQNWRDFLVGLLTPAAATLLAGYLCGAFYGNVSAASNGLSELSFNLLQLVNPANYLLDIQDFIYTWETQNYSAFLPILPSFSEWQEEGFSYLGLGVILMLVLAGGLSAIRTLHRQNTAKLARKSDARALHRQNTAKLARKADISTMPEKNGRSSTRKGLALCIPVLIYFTVFTLLALSPRFTIGNVKLLEIPYPDFIYDTLSIFRSTGRFAWMLHYGILALALLALCHLFRTARHGKLVLSLTLATLLFVQIIDLMPGLSDKHEAYTKEFADYVSPFQSSGWKILGENATQIMVCPPTGTFGLYNAPDTSCHLEQYALQYGLSLNVTYMSRDVSKAADKAARKHLETRKNGEKHPEIIYVFLQESTVPPATESGLNYYKLDGCIIGTDLNLDACTGVAAYTPPTSY
ncbi:MAG: hypothetical protein HFH23_01010 [Ruminococcus sp.]|nr:hypothetical protein [Ruminococcus sp.]